MAFSTRNATRRFIAHTATSAATAAFLAALALPALAQTPPPPPAAATKAADAPARRPGGHGFTFFHRRLAAAFGMNMKPVLTRR